MDNTVKISMESALLGYQVQSRNSLVSVIVDFEEWTHGGLTG